MLADVNCVVALAAGDVQNCAMFSALFSRTGRARKPLLGGVALAASLVASLATAQPAAADLEPCDGSVAAQDVVERLNELRRSADAPCAQAHAALAVLAWESRLAASAQEQAVDLAVNERLSHVDARQRSFGVRLRSVGYSASGAGENLAAGQSNLDDALAAWLASPSHCANLMQPQFSDVGVACVQRRGSRFERYWVAHFGAPVRR